MKKRLITIMALTLCVCMTTGCRGGLKLTQREKNPAGNKVQTVSAIKADYEKNEKYEYAEPMYNLPEDYNFEFDVTDDYFQNGITQDFGVYTDAELSDSGSCVISVDEDYDHHKVKISPNLVFQLNGEQSEFCNTGTWGSKSKFYLVQYVDLKTGKQLDKPIVTVFTIKSDLQAPTVTQSVDVNGNYSLKWNAIDGAEHYEVYRYSDGLDYATLEVTTQDTSCKYTDFATCIEDEKRFEELYGETEVSDAQKFSINGMLSAEDSYIVIAKSADGKTSRVGNVIKISEIANQVPVRVDFDFKDEFEGSTILDMPAYVDVDMLDGSLGQFVIDYHGCQVSELEDGGILLFPSVANLGIPMTGFTFRGMDYETFMDESKKLTEREDALLAKSLTQQTDINIPYVPDDTAPDSEVLSDDTQATDENTDENMKESQNTQTDDDGISTKYDFKIYANSALSKWLAVNLLNHNEKIPLDGFHEASDSDTLKDAYLEAYNQNPLIGIVDSVDIDYQSNSLLVSYVMNEADTEKMQKECLDKAESIASEITKSNMSDYEKEVAINDYLCENASYNEEILNDIDEDGSINGDVVYKYTNSFTPYGILCENYGVCESYAEAFLLIAQAADMEVIIETGKMQNVNHEWNKVKIDGGWYFLDVTNNDNDVAKNVYFNLPNDLQAKFVQSDSASYLDSVKNEYTASSMDYEYYTVNGHYADSKDEAGNLLAEDLSAGKDRASVRMDVDTSQADYTKAVENALQKAGTESCRYIFYAGVLVVEKQ